MTLWGGRFDRPADEAMHAFNASLAFDRRLAGEDVRGSVAWARALGAAGVLTAAEVRALVDGLEAVGAELAAGTFAFAPGDEDIHTAVERRLGERVGAVAGKLHTGRSRNDQVATDLRLWAMAACDALAADVARLQGALVAQAEAHPALAMPAYTHLQPAQPVTWAHWALSHVWPLARDVGRLRAARAAAAVLPLGSAALAGTGFPIDRAALAAELGFDAVCQNSLDGVADRDFALDLLYAAATLGVHLSRLSEQVILFATPAFGFVALDDAYATGSSLMPQKKNPDPFELARGKAGRLIGRLAGLLATLKGLPSAYDKDLQEDKEPLFDAFDTLHAALPVLAGAVGSLRVRPERLAAHLDPAMLATDLADWLVGRGVPFRAAHHLVGRVVRLAEARGVALDALSLDELRTVSEAFDEDALRVFDWARALEARAAEGGTARAALARQLAAARALLPPAP